MQRPIPPILTGIESRWRKLSFGGGASVRFGISLVLITLNGRQQVGDARSCSAEVVPPTKGAVSESRVGRMGVYGSNLREGGEISTPHFSLLLYKRFNKFRCAQRGSKVRSSFRGYLYIGVLKGCFSFGKYPYLGTMLESRFHQLWISARLPQAEASSAYQVWDRVNHG